MTAASNPAAELTEEERRSLRRAWTGGDSLDDVDAIVARIKSDAYEAGRLAAGGAAADEALRARVEAKWRQCARLSATAMDPDVREWTDAFAKDLRSLLDATHPPTEATTSNEEKTMKFRKKPVEIEAMEFKGSPTEATKIIDWALESNGTIRYHSGPREGLSINTLEGTMFADVGDWIIRGIQGEFYPCKPDIFAETYEPVEDGAR